MAKVMVIGGKSSKLLVATGTGKIAIFAESAVVKQFSPQLKAFFRKRVIGKNVKRRGWPAIRDFERKKCRIVPDAGNGGGVLFRTGVYYKNAYDQSKQ
jgi:hypothetical protein